MSIVKNVYTEVFCVNRIYVPPHLRELLNRIKDFHGQLGSFVIIGYLQSNFQTLDIYLGQVRPSLMLPYFSRISEFQHLDVLPCGLHGKCDGYIACASDYAVKSG